MSGGSQRQLSRVKNAESDRLVYCLLHHMVSEHTCSAQVKEETSIYFKLSNTLEEENEMRNCIDLKEKDVYLYNH